MEMKIEKWKYCIYEKKVVKKRKAGKASVALSTFPRYQNFYNG